MLSTDRGTKAQRIRRLTETFLMTDTAAAKTVRTRTARITGACVIAALLSLPAILRFPWTASDFLVMGVLLASVGLTIDQVVRLAGSVPSRLGSIVALLAAFLTVWANMAVGMIGDGLGYNLLFLLPPLVALGGAPLVRLAPRHMVRLCVVAAALQVIIAVGGYFLDPRGTMFSACFGLLWLLAARLFHADGRNSVTLRS
jgi:hypothetical protein